MKYLITFIIGVLISFNVLGKNQSYLNSDYYQVQDMIWEYGDSITHIDYSKRIIYFCNRGNSLYIGQINFNSNWIAYESEIHYINYFNNYSVREYLDTLRGLRSVMIIGNCFYLDNIKYIITKRNGKIHIQEKLLN